MDIFSCSVAVASRRFPDGYLLQFALPCGKKVEDFSNLLQPTAPFRIGSPPQERYSCRCFLQSYFFIMRNTILPFIFRSFFNHMLGSSPVHRSRGGVPLLCTRNCDGMFWIPKRIVPDLPAHRLLVRALPSETLIEQTRYTFSRRWNHSEASVRSGRTYGACGMSCGKPCPCVHGKNP